MTVPGPTWRRTSEWKASLKQCVCPEVSEGLVQRYQATRWLPRTNALSRSPVGPINREGILGSLVGGTDRNLYVVWAVGVNPAHNPLVLYAKAHLQCLQGTFSILFKATSQSRQNKRRWIKLFCDPLSELKPM